MRMTLAFMIVVIAGSAQLAHAMPSEPITAHCKIGIQYNDLDWKIRGDVVHKLGQSFGNQSLEETDAILSITRSKSLAEDDMRGVIKYENGQAIGFEARAQGRFLKMIPNCAQLAALQTMTEDRRNQLGYFSETEPTK